MKTGFVAQMTSFSPQCLSIYSENSPSFFVWSSSPHPNTSLKLLSLGQLIDAYSYFMDTVKAAISEQYIQQLRATAEQKNILSLNRDQNCNSVCVWIQGGGEHHSRKLHKNEVSQRYIYTPHYNVEYTSHYFSLSVSI